MLTRSEETGSESVGAAVDRLPTSEGGGGGDSVSISNLQTVLSDEPGEPWALVSLGGHLEDTAIANNLSALDINSINQESGVSSLSGTNGIALDGQTILSSLGPDDDADDADAIDGLLGPNPGATADNDDLSIPDTVPSNIRSIRGVGAANVMATRHASRPIQRQQQHRKRDAIVLVSFTLLFLGVSFLASTWRRSALRLEAELAALHNLKQVGGSNTNMATVTAGCAKPKSPPLFGGHGDEEATPFIVADNCYIKAKASVSLGNCGSELKDNLKNASSRIRKGFERFSRKFEESFWAFGNDSGGGNNNTNGTFFSSSSLFFGPQNPVGGTSQKFSPFAKFWETERNRWNKASKRIASEINAAANRAAENVHHTLNQTNEAIEHGMWSLVDHTRGAIEECTISVREINAGKGENARSTHNGAKLIQGFRTIFSNITSINLIAYELPSLGGAK
jgi:hypothetical protein